MFGECMKLTKDQWDRLNEKFDDMKSKLHSQSDTIKMLINENELLRKENDNLKKDGFLIDTSERGAYKYKKKEFKKLQKYITTKRMKNQNGKKEK